MLFALNAVLENLELGKCHLEKLEAMDIFPVCHKMEKKLASLNEKFWIADRETLRGRFENRLWLLDITARETTKLSNLVKQLSVTDRLLSNAVEERRDYDRDKAKDDQKYTDMLRHKVPYFLRYGYNCFCSTC